MPNRPLHRPRRAPLSANHDHQRPLSAAFDVPMHLHNGWQGIGNMNLAWPQDGSCPPSCRLPVHDTAFDRAMLRRLTSRGEPDG